MLVILNRGNGYAQLLENGAAMYPASQMKAYPLIEIAGQVTSLQQYETTIKTVRGLIDLAPVIATYGIDRLWGLDIYSGNSDFDLLMYGYVDGGADKVINLENYATKNVGAIAQSQTVIVDFIGSPFDAFIVEGVLINETTRTASLLVEIFFGADKLNEFTISPANYIAPKICLNRGISLRITSDRNIDGISIGLKEVNLVSVF